MPLFIGLGAWQLDRAEQKRNLAASLEIRRKQPPMPLDAEHPDAERLRFRQVEASGRYLNHRGILIENRKHQGKTGFHVITPLQLTEGGIVLVNRGWIAHDQIDRVLAAAHVEGPVSIQGEVRIPHPPAIQLTQQADTATGTPPRWPFITLDHYRAWSGLDILPFIVLLSPQNEHGFVRQWPHPRVSDLMHIGYAIQWFAFAIITLLVWLRLSLRNSAETETGT